MDGGREIRRIGYTRRAHRRHAFTRRHSIDVRGTTVKRSHVPASKITDRGAPGKWADLHGPGIGKLKKGSLSKYGYQPRNTSTSRHRAIRKAVHRYGPLSTLRKLQALGTYTRRTSKTTSKHAMADRNWVKKTFM